MRTFASRATVSCTAAVALTVAAASILQGCAPVIIAGAAGATMMAADRRTSVAQVDDGAIEGQAESSGHPLGRAFISTSRATTAMFC